jgi:ectoine hydroxylase-related dioxygenase (phytanoyl-CoA dioxygenase family)
VTRESSGLEYVKGSHRWNRRFKAVSPDYHPYLLASDLEDPPDIDGHREDYDLVNWDMEPGDVLMFHPLTLHGSPGNASATRRRRALATRWLGDDVVYAPVKARMPLPPGHGLSPGDKLGGRLFPKILG